MKRNTLHKSIFSLLLGIIVLSCAMPLVALAGPTDPPAAAGTPPGSPTTSAGDTGVANPTEDQLFYQFNYQQQGGKDITSQTKIGAVNALPKDTWQQTLSNLVKTLLNISGSLTLVALTVGGVFMIIAHGSTDLLGKGKKILVYSIAGLIIIAVSYAIVIGVSELQFFTPGSTGSPASGAGATGAAAPAANQTTPKGAQGGAVGAAPKS